MSGQLDSSRAELAEFGRRLRAHRTAVEESLRVAAVRFDINHQVLARIEQGIWMPDTDLEAQLTDWMTE